MNNDELYTLDDIVEVINREVNMLDGQYHSDNYNAGYSMACRDIFFGLQTIPGKQKFESTRMFREMADRCDEIMQDLMQDAQVVTIDTSDTWNDAIDKVLEIIHKQIDAVVWNDYSPSLALDNIHAAVQALKGGEE